MSDVITSTSSPTFHIREAQPDSNDAAFIVSAFDSTIPHLNSIGSGEQWGAEPFSSARPNFSKDIHDRVAKTGKYSGPESESAAELKGKQQMRTFIIEVEIPASAQPTPNLHSLCFRTNDDGKTLVSVGSATTRINYLSPYLVSAPSLCSVLPINFTETQSGSIPSPAPEDFLFLEILVTDYRTGPLRKGAGAAFIKWLAEDTKKSGITSVWVDCYAGNDRGLVK